METRQQARENILYEKNALYEVNIDFDDASESWKSNKKPKGNGCYTYICGQVLKNGKRCMREPGIDCETCHFHKKK
jgi:hypothetical protein